MGKLLSICKGIYKNEAHLGPTMALKLIDAYGELLRENERLQKFIADMGETPEERRRAWLRFTCPPMVVQPSSTSLKHYIDIDGKNWVNCPQHGASEDSLGCIVCNQLSKTSEKL